MGFSFLTQELAIDLGTANTVIFQNDKIILDFCGIYRKSWVTLWLKVKGHWLKVILAKQPCLHSRNCKMDSFSFEKLQVYQQAKEYVKDVYSLTYKFPQNERYCLCDQLKRAAVSIVSNIAKGSGRNSYKDKVHFVEIAYGSLMESLCQLQIAADLGFIN